MYASVVGFFYRHDRYFAAVRTYPVVNERYRYCVASFVLPHFGHFPISSEGQVMGRV